MIDSMFLKGLLEMLIFLDFPKKIKEYDFAE